MRRNVYFVSFWCLNWCISLFFVLPLSIYDYENIVKVLTTSANADMTFPNVVRDLLMFAPSWSDTHTQKTTTTVSMKGNNKRSLVEVCPVWVVRSFTFSLVPFAPVESALSLPARSTRLILLTCRTQTNHDVNKQTNKQTTSSCSRRLHSAGRHLLWRVFRVGIVPLLCEDDVEDGVRTTAGLIHVGGGDGPAKWQIWKKK